MFSIIFLGALCFGTTVESLQTITHSDHLDVMHEPVYICILAGIDFLVWCVVFRCIGGYTFHQRTAVESNWLKHHPHYPCPNTHKVEEEQNLDNSDDECEESVRRVRDNKKSIEPLALQPVRDRRRTFFDDPRHDTLNLSRDLAPCFILIVTCLIVYLIDQKDYPDAPKYVDPIMALVTIVFLIVSSLPMLKKASLILLQSLPEEMEDVEILCKDLKSAFSKYISDLHEVHVWCLVPTKIYATLHIVFKDEDSYLSTLSEIHPFLLKYGINHATIQPEFDNDGKDSETQQRSLAPSTEPENEEEENGTDLANDVNGDSPKEYVSCLGNTCHLPCPKGNCMKKRCCMSKEAITSEDI